MSSTPQRIQESFVTLPAREWTWISELDSRLQDEIAEYGSLKGFHITMWRDEPDETGCNWKARVERIKGYESSGSSWWDVVPRLRNRFNHT